MHFMGHDWCVKFSQRDLDCLSNTEQCPVLPLHVHVGSEMLPKHKHNFCSKCLTMLAVFSQFLLLGKKSPMYTCTLCVCGVFKIEIHWNSSLTFWPILNAQCLINTWPSDRISYPNEPIMPPMAMTRHLFQPATIIAELVILQIYFLCKFLPTWNGTMPM